MSVQVTSFLPLEPQVNIIKSLNGVGTSSTCHILDHFNFVPNKYKRNYQEPLSHLKTKPMVFVNVTSLNCRTL